MRNEHMKDELKISIVTVTYNDKEHLKKTLDSIIVQNYKNYSKKKGKYAKKFHFAIKII